MDRGVIENMKRRYKATFLRKLILYNKTNHESGITTFLKSWNLSNTAETIADAREAVSSSTLAKAWKSISGNSFHQLHSHEPNDSLREVSQCIGDEQFSSESIENWAEEATLAWRKIPLPEMIRKKVNSELDKDEIEDENENYDEEDELSHELDATELQSTLDSLVTVRKWALPEKRPGIKARGFFECHSK